MIQPWVATFSLVFVHYGRHVNVRQLHVLLILALGVLIGKLRHGHSELRSGLFRLLMLVLRLHYGTWLTKLITVQIFSLIFLQEVLEVFVGIAV